jgi:hypothetical protein
LAFEGLREQVRDRWSELVSQIQETSAFNTLREKFESQSVTTQRLIMAGGALVLALFVLSFPYGYYSQSNEYLSQFEENRELIRGLLRASRSAGEPSPLPPPLGQELMRQEVNRIVRERRLLPEQVGDIQGIPGTPAKNLAPPIVMQNGLVVQLKKLNVAQIVEMATAFQNLAPGVKLIGLDVIQTAGQTHYYDMIAKIVHFGLESVTIETGGAEGGKLGNKRKPSHPEAEAEGEE